jgi:hypothetical protein
MKIFPLTLLLLSLTFFCGCERISQRIEDKVNEKIDKTIDNSLNKIDSLLKNEKIDSLKSKMENSLNKSKKKITN